MKLRGLLLIGCLVLSASAQATSPDAPGSDAAAAFSPAELPPPAVVQHALWSVSRGSFDEGIDWLESLSDRGLKNPDVSYNRAFAYLERARSREAQPGDLGSAVAALEEARLLDPSDSSLDAPLDQIRAEIARRRARQGNSPVVQRPSLGRAVVQLLPEFVWAILAAVGSFLIAAGLLLRRVVRRRWSEIASAVGITLGCLLLVVGGSVTRVAQQYRTRSAPAVVVVTEARFSDEQGRPLEGRSVDERSVPEGALVYVHEVRADRVRVEWGSIQGWLGASQVRRLATP